MRLIRHVNVDILKLYTSISWRAYTGESRTFVDASGTIFASAGLAGVVFVLTANTGVIVRTSTIQARTKILTAAVVHAWISDAAFRCCFALLAIGSRWATVG